MKSCSLLYSGEAQEACEKSNNWQVAVKSLLFWILGAYLTAKL
jgi:hypothetical protein